MRHVPGGILPVVTIDRGSSRPLYRQLCDAYREAIVERRLRGGERVPSTRAVAAELGISRVPVLNAFEQLIAEGYFEGRRGSGTYVARSLVHDRSPTAVLPRRAAARPTSGVPGSAPEPWLGGFGAFRVSEPAVDH